MNLEDLFKIVSLILGSCFIPWLIAFIIFKEYMKKKAAYIFLFILFIAFCINFYIFHLGEIIGGIALCIPVFLIYGIIFAFIVCNVSDKKTFLNKFNILICSFLLILFLTSPLLLLAIADEKFKYNHSAKIKVKKVAAAICVFPSIKAEIYRKLAYDNLNYNQEEVIKNYELAYKYDKNLNINLVNFYLEYKQYEKAENLARKTNFEYGLIESLLAQGKAKEAEEFSRKTNFNNGLIEALLAQGKIKEAEEIARKSNLIRKLIYILLSQGRNNEALEIAKQKLGENSQHYSDHILFIEIYLAMNDYENAQKHVQMGFDIPDVPIIDFQSLKRMLIMKSDVFYTYQTIIYAKKGDITNAKKEYKKITDNYNALFEEYNIDVNLLKD